MIFISLKNYKNIGGKFFSYKRIMLNGYLWTPFVIIKKRYKTWLGYWNKK